MSMRSSVIPRDVSQLSARGVEFVTGYEGDATGFSGVPCADIPAAIDPAFS